MKKNENIQKKSYICSILNCAAVTYVSDINNYKPKTVNNL